MRILLAANSMYYPAYGGASKVIELLLTALVRRGHVCCAVVPGAGLQGDSGNPAEVERKVSQRFEITTSTRGDYEFFVNNVKVHAVRDHATLGSHLEAIAGRFRPDCVIISSEDAGLLLLERAFMLGSPVFYLSQTTQMLPSGPTAFFPNVSKAKLLGRCVGIIAVSSFLQQYLRSHLGVESVVLPLPVYGDGPFPIFGFRNGQITMVNPCKVKGIDIFLGMAGSLPDYRFAAVPTWGTTSSDLEQLRSLTNVQIVPPASDINDILRTSSILVVPSLWDEAFGRIVIEAMLRGVPVIASNTGGLPEAKLGIDYVVPVRSIQQYSQDVDERMCPIPLIPAQDISEWVSVVRRLTEVGDLYSSISVQSRESALAFNSRLDIVPVEQYLHERSIFATESTRSQISPISITTIPDEVTVARQVMLAAKVRERRRRSIESEQQQIPKARQNGSTPLSFAQERLWFLHQYEPLNPFYNESAALRLTGHLDDGSVHHAISQIVERHEALRTTFPTLEGEAPVAVLRSAPFIDFDTIDYSSPDQELDDATVISSLVETARKPFDLSAGPLLRVRLVHLQPDRHILLVVAHHVVADNWSLAIFLREFAAFYTAARQGERPNLAPLRIQYADFAHWQRKRIQGAALDAGLKFWKELLAATPELHLPYRSYRTASLEGDSFEFWISKDVASTARQFAIDHQVTLFHVLLTAFQTVLHLYSGQDSILTGTPVTDRSTIESEEVIGCFANIMVLPGDFRFDPTFEEALRRMSRIAVEAQPHRHVPFEKVVEAIQPDRSPEKHPLFQVMFALQNTPSPPAPFSGLEVQILKVPLGVTKFDLYLDVTERRDGLRGVLEFRTHLFDKTTIARFAQQFQFVLETVVNTPWLRVSDIPLMTSAESERIIHEWNQSEALHPAKPLLHSLFEEQVARTPHAAAVLDAERTISYEELDGWANQIAHMLHDLGAGPEDRIGVCLDRGPELIAVLLGILKAGGAYVALDPTYPAERLRYMASDSEARAIFIEADSRDVFAGSTLLIDARDASGHARDAVTSGVLPANAAYMLYTSGSTGRPKSAVLEHRNASTFLAWARETFRIDMQGCVTASTSICFDSSVMEIFGPLIAGGSVRIVQNALALEDIARDTPIDMVSSVPSAIRALCHAPIFDHLRTIVMAGEPISRQMLADIHKGAPAASLFNLYGLTEATTYSTIACLEPGPEQPPIGRPIANTQVYIVDRNLRPVPAGMTGELYVGGDGLARGYWKRPGLTAERFVPDPFSGRPGSRLYRTGDRARWREDGQIDLLGRVDSQIKLRGYRVELREVEAVLREHPGVRDAVALVTGSSGDQLVAYATCVSSDPMLPTELRTWLRGRLPEYMVPVAVEVLEKMPFTPNGKLNRKALPVPRLLEELRIDVAVSPRNEMEQTIADVWREVLDVHAVGVHDDFFELGGHSLIAVRVASRLKKTFGIQVPVRLLFTERTVARLAEEVAHILQASRPGTFHGLGTQQRMDDVPLSLAQEQLWFMGQSHPNTAINSLPACLNIHGPIDLDALEWSFHHLVERHESLRTSFPSVHGQPLAHIQSNVVSPLQHVNIAGPDEVAVGRRFSELIRDFATEPFVLSTGPLFRSLLVTTAPLKHSLLINLHHIICDGWSLGILARELGELYRSAIEGTKAAPRPLQHQYSDFAAWQRGQLDHRNFDRQLAFWKKTLQPIDCTLKLGADRARPQRPTFRGSRIALEIDLDTVSKLKALAADSGATLFMVIASVLKALLHLATGEMTITVRTPVAGRHTIETEDIVGNFINEIVLQTTVTDALTFRELIGAVREVALAAFANAEVPFGCVVQELNPARSPKYQPFSQVTLAMQNAQQLKVSIPGATVELVELPTDFCKLDLHFNVREERDGLNVTLTYSTDLFDVSTIDRMAGHFRSLLDRAARDPDQHLASTSMPDQVSRCQIPMQSSIGGWNVTVYAHDRIALQARMRPNAVAVVCEGEEMDYATLHRRSNQLARYLRKSGVKAEHRVAVCLERSSTMVIALLAILKSGGVYVPLDPQQPQQRLAYILDETQPSVILTSGKTDRHISQHGRQTICLDAHGHAFRDCSTEDLSAAIVPENSAYIIYTSGSTGQPKGAAVTHRGLVNLAKAQTEVFAVSPSDRVLQFASVTFDASIFEMTLGLASGAALYIMPPWQSLVGNQFSAFLRDNEITVATLPPSVLTGSSLQQLPSLRKLILAGEEPSSLVIEHWARDRMLFNAYGPTETTVWASTAICSTETPTNVIGRPVPGAQAYILDAGMQPVPAGMKGELYIGGQGVARGYLNRPAQSAERFVPDPFSGVHGARLYRTGDLAIWRSDGQIGFLGRADSQVKIRGHRIELGEIEAVIRGHREVLDAIVVVREEGSGSRSLVAYVVAQPNTTGIANSIQELCVQCLPEYEIPSAIVIVESFPLTSNGKIDRASLPSLAQSSGESLTKNAEPRNPTEDALLAIFRQVLNKPTIGIHDNFFELGGDSILSIQVIGRAIELGIDASPEDIFRYQTVAELASAKPISHTMGFAEGAEVCEAPLTSIQNWLLEQRFAEPNHYNQAIVLEATEEVAVPALARAVNHVIGRYDAFRLRFHSTAEGIRQHLAPAETNAILLVDISSLTSAEQEDAYNEICDRLQRSLDLIHGPLTRAAWFERSEGSPGTLLWIAHHAAVDWVSWRILLDDLGRCYSLYRETGSPGPPPTTTTPFLSWASKIEQCVESGEFDHLLPVWLQASEVLAAPLRVDSLGGANTVEHRQKQITSFDKETTRLLLEQVPAVSKVQITDVLLTALEAALAEWNGPSSVYVEVEVHGREDILKGMNLTRTVGWFTSSFPVLMNDGPSSHHSESALARMKEKTSRTRDRGISYGLLRYLRKSNEAQRLRERPRPEIGFNYLGQFDGVFSTLPLFRRSLRSPGSVEDRQNSLPHKIAAVAYVVDGSLHVEWSFSGRSYRMESVAELAEKYSHAVLDILGEVEQRTSVKTEADSRILVAALSEVEFNQ